MPKCYVKVQGSEAEPYLVTINELAANDITVRCSCPANNRGGLVCKHIAAILVGDITNIVEGEENVSHLKRLSDKHPLMQKARSHIFKRCPRDENINTVKQVYEKYSAKFKKAGWAVEYNKTGAPEYQESIDLYTFFKNGKKRKAPTYSLIYQRNTADLHIFEGGITDRIYRPKMLPWYYKGQAYKYLDKALEHFLKDIKDYNNH